jgi:hypothetical protein
MKAFSTTLPAPDVSVSAVTSKWQREHEAFQRMKDQLLKLYAGQYVVIHDGQVAGSGPDEIALALQFFAEHGNVAVHIGLVTAEPELAARIPHYRDLTPRGAA